MVKRLIFIIYEKVKSFRVPKREFGEQGALPLSNLRISLWKILKCSEDRVKAFHGSYREVEFGSS